MLLQISKILPGNSNKVGKILTSPINVLSVVASQFIWYNEYIKIDNTFLKKTLIISVIFLKIMVR